MRAAPEAAGSTTGRVAAGRAGRAARAARAAAARAAAERAGATATATTAEAAANVAPARATSSATPAAIPGTTRALIWRLQSGGWTSTEAGNLAAIALGLRPARNGWTGSELDHLRFLKSLVHAGRIER